MGCLKIEKYHDPTQLKVEYSKAKPQASHEAKRELMWLSVDPLWEEYADRSPYEYTHSNPIKFTDPDGKKIILPKGTPKSEIMLIMGNLQKLTNDKLVYSTQKDGSIRVKVASLGKGEKTTGTNLIRSLNSSEKTLTIMIENGKNNATPENLADAKNGKGTNSTIRIDPSMDIQLNVEDGNGGSKLETVPDQVVLGHEMVHAKDHMEGTLNRKEANHQYIGSNGEIKKERGRISEFRASGFKGFEGKDGISENSIRKEQGEKPRASYGM